MKMSEADGEYKGFNIRKTDAWNLVEIKAIGQGPVPDPLRGMFTTKSAARSAIDFFLKDKEIEGGKTKSIRKG